MKYVRHHAPFSDVTKGAEGLGHFGGDDELAANFVDLIQGKAASKTPIQTGVQSAYTCLAAKQSAETGELCGGKAGRGPLISNLKFEASSPFFWWRRFSFGKAGRNLRPTHQWR